MAITIIGKVIHGDQYGRVLGFPTANLDRRQYVRSRMNVKFGVYAGNAEILNSKSPSHNGKISPYVAAIVIGPLDAKGFPKIEAHLINFSANLYGKKIQITLKKYLRPFKKYQTEAILKKQIQEDVKKVLAIGCSAA